MRTKNDIETKVAELNDVVSILDKAAHKNTEKRLWDAAKEAARIADEIRHSIDALEWVLEEKGDL